MEEKILKQQMDIVTAPLMMRKVLFILSMMLSFNVAHAQKDTFIPKEYRNAKFKSWKMCTKNDFLIEENQYYSFRIKKITLMRDGYLIRATTKAEGKKVSVLLVSPIEDAVPCSAEGDHLRIGKKQKLSLQRYNEMPGFHIGWTVGSVVDVMLGNHTVSINESGYYWYLFSSLDVNGLNVRDEMETDALTAMFCKDSLEIKKLLDSFIQHICFKQTMFERTDTVEMKNSLLRYGSLYWSRSLDVFSEGHYKKRSWYVDSVPPLLSWDTHPYNIDTSNVEIMLQKTLYDNCNLPIPDTLMNTDIKTDRMKLKYVNLEKNLYTVQVEWSIPSLYKTFILVVNVKKDEDKFVVCGLNKPYHGYAMSMKSNNKKMIQRGMNAKSMLMF